MGEMFKRPVDYGKLIEALKEKGTTPQKAGLKLGYPRVLLHRHGAKE